MKNKGISTVIANLIMVVIVITTVIIVWRVILVMTEEKISESESCYNLYGKVTINPLFTCYNSTSKEMQFSISLGDLEVDEVLVAISGDGVTKSFKITNQIGTVENLKNYTNGNLVQLPGKNGGLTYKFNASDLSGKPKLIEVAPVINKKQCDKTDAFSEIEVC